MRESIASMPRYAAYKDSGVEWLGVIPAHWEQEKLGTCLKSASIKNRVDLPLLSITRERGVIARDIEDQEGNHNFIPDDLSNYKLLKKGQFGMNKMKAWQGSYGVSSHTGIVSPAYYIFDFTFDIFPAFFHKAIRSKLYVTFFARASDGVRIGQWDLSKTRMKEILFLIPPLSEQKAIAGFLDRKTALIDQAVSIKQRQIELLKERKQILIQNAVTRGLGSTGSPARTTPQSSPTGTVPEPAEGMHDSGVEWIGKIPAHWKIKRLKYVLNERNERSNTGDEPLFMVSQVHGLVVRSEYHKKAEVAQSNVGNKIVYKNDLVFNKLKAHLGVFFKSNINFKGLVSPDYAVYKPKKYIHDMKFLEHLFRHPAYISQFIIRATGVVEGLIRLYTNELVDISVAIPPENEQIDILSFIEAESAKIDKAIELQQQQIEKLKEYKATLINSAVTGTIKVI